MREKTQARADRAAESDSISDDSSATIDPYEIEELAPAADEDLGLDAAFEASPTSDAADTPVRDGARGVSDDEELIFESADQTTAEVEAGFGPEADDSSQEAAATIEAAATREGVGHEQDVAPRDEPAPGGAAGEFQEPAQILPEDSEAAPGGGSALEDPLFDDLIPDSYEPNGPGSGSAATPEAHPLESGEEGGESLPDFDPGPTAVDDGLRDFDEFLQRELIPEDMPAAATGDSAAGESASPAAPGAAEASEAGEGASKPPAMFADEDYDAFMDPDSNLSAATKDGELPRWPYDPPGPDADPAREKQARIPGDDEDPFGLWEKDAEKEAEQQARQLELKGDSLPARSEEGMLFEVDEGFTTAPAEAHIASQKKIDHYLSLFDITKEISNISEFDELWENILYAIMGQVGAETICILSSTSRVSSGAIFYPVSHSGFELPEGWALGRGDEIYDQMATSTGVRYAEEFLNSLQNPVSPLERRILENTRAKLVVPLKNMNQMFGIVILGGQVSGDDYTIDDIEFLTLLGEIAAVGVDRVLSRIEFERDTEELRRRNMVHGSMFSLARRASGVKNLDEIYDILTRHLREDFYAESFSVVLLSPRERRYRIFAGNNISPESIEKFSLDVNSELIATISNLVRVYDLKDFRENRELAGCYTNDDLGLMQHYWIVPLINMNWLVGFITIHRTKIPWTEFHRELMVTAAEIVSSVFANCIIMNERESLFRDPFSPLEERLKEELKKSAQFQAPVSLVDIRVKNIRRILEINPGEEVTGFLTALNRSIASSLFETDFMARVGQGRFALILPGRGKVEADIFVKKLKADFNRMRLLPGSPIDVQYSHQIISSPDEATEAGKMLSIFE